eukprot:gb/GECH01013011.1/.p1 GENE.gb/GECH01013011.1/~~gb/GECH01013011.1/.p1  ORF type:complete len:636 (+),score=158.98 gb/GECH01013011.1/:1-1908(+)
MMMSSVPPNRNPQWSKNYPSPPFNNNTTSQHFSNFPVNQNTELPINSRVTALHSPGQASSSAPSQTTSANSFNQAKSSQNDSGIDIEDKENNDWDFTLLSNTHMSANSEGTFHPMVLADRDASLRSSSIGSEGGGFPPLLTGLPDHRTRSNEGKYDDEAPSPTALSEDGELSHMVKGVAGLLDDEEDYPRNVNGYHQHGSPLGGGYQNSPLPDSVGATLSPVHPNSWNIEDGMFEFEENISPLPPNGIPPRTPPPAAQFINYEGDNLGQQHQQQPIIQPSYSPHTNPHSPSPIRVSGPSHHPYSHPQYYHYHRYPPPSPHNNGSNNNNRNHNHSNYRGRSNTICKFFIQGNCKAGDNCKFSHDISIRGSPSSRSPSISPLQSLSPGMEYSSFVSDDTQSLESSTSGSNGSNSNNQSICKFFLQGYCRKGDRCPFKHELSKSSEPPHRGSPQSSPLQTQNLVDTGDFDSSRSFEFPLDNNPYNNEDVEKSKNRESPGEEQIKICPFFINGECRYGGKCRFLHLNLDPSDERRIKLAEESKRKQSTIPCKHFDFGKGICPYGEECYFVHVDLTDGDANSDIQPYLCCDANGKLTDVGSRTLSDFVENAEQGSLKSPSPSSVSPHKKRSKSKSRKKRY